MRQTLVENFGIDCQYYAKVDFKSFEKVIDALFMNGEDRCRKRSESGWCRY